MHVLYDLMRDFGELRLYVVEAVLSKGAAEVEKQSQHFRLDLGLILL